MRELATLLRNEGIEAAISTPHYNFSVSILLLSHSKKLGELRAPVVQTCNILRQLIYTEKQIISTSKTQSLDLKHGVANVTYIHKFSYILICKVLVKSSSEFKYYGTEKEVILTKTGGFQSA